MQELSLVISNPGEGNWLQHIEWNKAEFEAAISEAVKDYQGLAYTDDQIKEAKADRAELNKLKKAIDERRKAVKKAISAPYDEFEKEVREVTQKLDAAVAQIDAQVKAYEEKQKEEKKAAIEKCFRSKVGPLETTVTFDRIFDPKWLNATVTMKTIDTEMTARLANIQNGYDFCKNLPEGEKDIAVMAFEKNFDLGYAIGEVNLYKQRKAAEEAAKEEARQREENQQRLEKIVGETDETGDALNDALGAAVDINEVLEIQSEADSAEDHEGGKIIKTITIPFNGRNIDFILGAIRVATMPKRGKIIVSFQGTAKECDNVLEELKNKDIRFKENQEEAEQ